ncbi:hypothetical protein [Clostridium sp. UBA4548]|uniref:hypothetical protein n=1 Tax=Clostridium sp. UBA4548 TaxID=1946361 RepID=UPI0025C47DE4|nr:hypothetical protein [Clostridium sp. UBA4548]
MASRGNYFVGVKMEPLTQLENELKEKIIFTLRNYDNIISEIENNKLVLELPNLSEDEKMDIQGDVLRKTLRLKYIDNLIMPLTERDKKILFLKYVNELTWAEVKDQLGIKGETIQSASGLGYKIIKYLTHRANPLIFQD